jgi:hypothetical protein
MKRENNIFHGGSESPLDRNISRLMKLADDSGQPSKAFTESLIDNALDELGRVEAKSNHNHCRMPVIISQWEKVAAMLAVVCGAGFGLFVTVMAHLSSGFAALVLIAMFVNQLIYYGGLIL